MEQERRHYIYDGRLNNLIAKAKEFSRLAIGYEIIYPEYFFWEMMVEEEVFVRSILSATRGNAYSTAFRKTRMYSAEPLRHPYSASPDEIERGMSEDMYKLMQGAGHIAKKMTEEDPYKITLELVVAAAGSVRVPSDIVFNCWGVDHKKLRLYIRDLGVELPLTQHEEASIAHALEVTMRDLENMLRDSE